jgi:hypothetical protein
LIAGTWVYLEGIVYGMSKCKVKYKVVETGVIQIITENKI